MPLTRPAAPVANSRAFIAALLAALAAAALLFVFFGLASPPIGRTPQQAAGYFGIRLIPVGLCLMLIGFAETLALVVADALAAPPAGPIRARATIGLSTLAELLRAVTGLSATPAGIGARRHRRPGRPPRRLPAGRFRGSGQHRAVTHSFSCGIHRPVSAGSSRSRPPRTRPYRGT
jgi:hypothetical protein